MRVRYIEERWKHLETKKSAAIPKGAEAVSVTYKERSGYEGYMSSPLRFTVVVGGKGDRAAKRKYW